MKMNRGRSICWGLPLDARQNSGDIVRRTPPVLKDIQAQFTRGVDVRVEHLTNELDSGRLVRILLLEMHHESEGTVLKRRVGRSDDDGVPYRFNISINHDRIRNNT